jgi:hypothetical protein
MSSVARECRMVGRDVPSIAEVSEHLIAGFSMTFNLESLDLPLPLASPLGS